MLKVEINLSDVQHFTQRPLLGHQSIFSGTALSGRNRGSQVERKN